jgi:hypothetical protein
MKTTVLLLGFLVSALMVIAQQVPRDKVIVEIGTGTW